MMCHDFKGGIGTASRRLDADDGGYTVGVLVQANYGRRERLAIDGVPVGREIGFDEVPSDWVAQAASDSGHRFDHRHPRDRRATLAAPVRDGSRNAPAWAWRAAVVPARTRAATSSSPSRRAIAIWVAVTERWGVELERTVRMLDDGSISPLFWAAIESTEEAIANALVAAETTVGRDGHTSHRLPHDRLLEIWQRYRGAGR